MQVKLVIGLLAAERFNQGHALNHIQKRFRETIPIEGDRL